MRSDTLKQAVCTFLLFFPIRASIAQSPVPVVKEPFHKVAFSNEYIRILDVHIPPGDTTLYHIHKTNSAIIFESRNKTGTQILGGKAVSGQAIPGNTTYAPFGDTPVTHRVWNEDTAVYHVFDIELVNQPRGSLGPVLSNSGLRMAWGRNLARAYQLVLQPGNVFSLKGSDHPYLLVRTLGSAEPFRMSTSTKGKLRPIYFVWYPVGTGLEFTNKETTAEECILLELN